MPSRRLLSLTLAVFVTTLSIFAETRRSERTDMRQLAAELTQVLGKDHVEIRGGEGAAAPQSNVTAIIDAMNRERVARGLTPLRINQRLMLAANDRVGDMLSKHYFDHVSPDGINPFQWVVREGYDYRQAGENLAIGYRTPDDVVDGWMHSPAHRANLLGEAFDEVGVAVSPQSPMRSYGAPLVVALYGSR